MGNLFESLDRNKHWKVFRHAKAFGDIFDYFGGWVWLSGFAATIIGGALSYLATLPWWGKALLGLVAFLVVLLIAFVIILIAGSFGTETGNDDPPLKSTGAQKFRRWLGVLAMPVIILVAALMSAKYHKPVAAPNGPVAAIAPIPTFKGIQGS
jgi:hypothetical protein